MFITYLTEAYGVFSAYSAWVSCTQDCCLGFRLLKEPFNNFRFLLLGKRDDMRTFPFCTIWLDLSCLLLFVLFFFLVLFLNWPELESSEEGCCAASIVLWLEG